MTNTERLLDYLATMKEDPAAAMALLSDDATWINILPDHVPFGGEYHGREAIAHYFQLMADTFVVGSYPIEQFDFIDAGDTLVVVGYEKDGRVLPTGRVFDLHFIWVVKFNEQGQIRYLREHNDTAAIGDAFRE